MKIERDYSISFIRLLAMSFIVICHIMQYFDFELAWWFNVGVQIFLCLSGYLYGKKKKIDTIKFYIRNFFKIFISFCVVIIPFIIIEYLYNFIKLDIVIDVIIGVKYIPGGEHLWFIATILLCYFLTPFLFDYFNYIKNKKKMLVYFILLLYIIYVVNSSFVPHFRPAWISCYVIGFFLARISEYEKMYNIVYVIICCLMLLTNAIQISIDYIFKINVNYYYYYYLHFCNYAHVLLGVFIFMSLRKMLMLININDKSFLKFQKILDITDNYSYEIYLVHQFFILGPFTLMGLTDYNIINIVIIVFLTCVIAFIVKKISVKLSKVLLKNI